MINTGHRALSAISGVLIALLSLFWQAGPAAAAGLFGQTRYAAIVVDASNGEVLYAKRADAVRYPASITKIMTLYLTFEALSTGRLKLQDRVTVSAHAASMMPSKTQLRAGDDLSVDEAIKAVAVHSANDIAAALAEKVGGTETRFAALMTLRAQELGMANSRFVNANGVPDPRQITTARDIAILSRAVMRDYPQYYSYFGIRSFQLHGQLFTNHNHLLREPGYDGFKTGFTNAAGFNLSASAVRDGRRLITVVLGGSSAALRDDNVQTLMNAGFNVLKRRTLGERTTIAANIAEPDDSGPIQRGSVEQGDGGDTGLKVELNDVAHGGVVSDQLSAEERHLDLKSEMPPPGLRGKIAAAPCAAARGRRHHRRGACAVAKVQSASSAACAGRHGRAAKACQRKALAANAKDHSAGHRRARHHKAAA
jgi:D-alanyl-D-alanine carboxypeptidase (penicillin-binding protein 5/6)